MSALAAGARLTLSPSALDETGAGVCPLPEATVHVAGALPGEQVVAEVEHVSPHRRGGRQQAWARLQQVLAPSPDRVPPVCPGYGACGGCPLQHLAYPAQLDWKRARVQEALARVPTLAGVAVAPCLASPRPLGYRNQAKYVYGRLDEAAGGGGRLALGAYAPRSHRLVDLRGCQVVEPVLDQTAGALLALLAARAVAPFDEQRRTGIVRYVVLRANAAGQVLVTLVVGRGDWADAPALAQALMAAVPAVAGVVEHLNADPGNAIFGAGATRLLAGGARLPETLSPAGVTVELPAQAFLQLNRGVAALAYQAIREQAAARAPLDRVLDVYAGVGSISFALADLCREIWAVEENPQATATGARAAQDMAIARRGQDTNVHFVTAGAEKAGELLTGADLVVLNPPRAGVAPGLLAALAAAPPAAAIYLSCNPASLARDLALLDGRLAVAHVQPLDMLPHTPHVEALVVLERPARAPSADLPSG
jgi:23S rRNA (uracil1939-C5)-methyltransferase